MQISNERADTINFKGNDCVVFEELAKRWTVDMHRRDRVLVPAVVLKRDPKPPLVTSSRPLHIHGMGQSLGWQMKCCKQG